MSRDKQESIKGIKLGGNCCVICGWQNRDHNGQLLVEGAHVRQYLNVSDYDKSDNIIGLCPNHHTEFDKGSIAIIPKNKMCMHINNLDQFNGKKLIGNIDHIRSGYLDYHNKQVFKGSLNL